MYMLSTCDSYVLLILAMPKLYRYSLLFILLVLGSRMAAQPTVLAPGDIIVLGVITDLTGCGKPLDRSGDEIAAT